MPLSSHAHQHSNIHVVSLPPLSTFRRYLKGGGWLEMSGDADRVKFARAGHFVYVPRPNITNYAGLMRMTLLQTAIAEDWKIQLELPAALQR